MDQPPEGLEFKTLAVADPVAGPAEPDQRGMITALVAVTGVKDQVNDIIVPGAFRRTLAERPRPKVCLGHDWNRPVGKTLEIHELMPGDRRLPAKTADGKPWPREAGALLARWQANLDSEDGKSAYSNAKFFGPKESTFSIGYRTVRARQRGSVRYIHDLDLFEYGPVLNPANRLATLQSIKADDELTNPVDSERQDFETGGDAVEFKVRRVHDAEYWGRPAGTIITPGMKPVGGDDTSRGTTTAPAPAPSEKPKESEEDRPEKPAAEDRPPKKKPAKPKKITASQKAALFSAAPGSVMTYRRDDAGNKIYAGPFPRKQGLVAKIPANVAHPLEKAGHVEAATDGRHYILTDEGERLRARLESEDSDRQEKLRVERQAAALGPETVAPADAHVVADAAPMDMTAREFKDAKLAAEARRKRATNIRAEEENAKEERREQLHAEQAALFAPKTLDLAAFQMLRQGMNRPADQRAKVELAGGDRFALVGPGTKNWSVSTARNLGAVRALDFEERDGAPPNKAALRDLANRLAAIRDKDGRQIPSTLTNEGGIEEWAPGWRDAEGNDLRSVVARVAEAWGKENGLTYRLSWIKSRPLTVPGGAADAEGFRMRKAEELAPGDEVRLPDGSTGIVERSGADSFRLDAEDLGWNGNKDIGGQVVLTDGRTVSIYKLAGVEPPQVPEVQPGESRVDAMVARQRGSYAGPPPQDQMVPVRFAEDADSEAAQQDPGMGPFAATGGPPGRTYQLSDIVGAYSEEYARTLTPYPAGTRVVFSEQEQRASDSFRPRDRRAKVGTLLDLVEEHGGEVFQTVRLDDGTYDQYRVAGMRESSNQTFDVDPPTDKIDEVRAAHGLPPVGESTPLRRAESNAEEPSPAESTRTVEGDKIVPGGAGAVERRYREAEDRRPGTWRVEFWNDADSRHRYRDVRNEEEARNLARRLSRTWTTDVLPPIDESAESVKPESSLPYEILRKPAKGNLTARVRYNGREYDVAATNGVNARVTVTDDDGHTAHVSGGSTTLLMRERGPDRERAVREALEQVEAQHGTGESDSRTDAELGRRGAELRKKQKDGATSAAEDQEVSDLVALMKSRNPASWYWNEQMRNAEEAALVDAEPPVVESEPEPTVALAPELVDEAAALQDEVLGITEQPDGTFEVTEEVAARQDRVAALIDADDGGALDLGSKSTPELTETRVDLSEELRLQSVLASRQTEPKPTVLRSPAGQAEKPPQRPGLAGAAEDYAEALNSGDAEAIARTRARLQSSLRRSRVTSDTARTLADHVAGEGDDEAERLLAAARGLREESRSRRNAAARRRRQARRLERVRIQSLIDKIDAELQTRARSTEPQQPTPAEQSSTPVSRMERVAVGGGRPGVEDVYYLMSLPKYELERMARKAKTQLPGAGIITTGRKADIAYSIAAAAQANPEPPGKAPAGGDLGDLTNRAETANVARVTSDQVRDADDDALASMLAEYADDDTAVELVLAEMDRRQRDAEITEAISEDDQWRRLDELMAAGWDEESAVEEALGVSVAEQRRERAITMLRNQGYSGARFEELARKSYRDYVAGAYRDAEDATRGTPAHPRGAERRHRPRAVVLRPRGPRAALGLRRTQGMVGRERATDLHRP